MMPAAERLRQLFHKRFGPLPLVGIVTTGVLFILAAIFENWISGVAVPYFLAGVRNVLARPVGVFGLLFFALLIAVVLIALAETSPTGRTVRAWLERDRHPAPAAPVITAEDQNSIHRLRVVWNQQGELAGYRLFDLFAAVLSGQQERLYWSELLFRLREDLQDSRATMTGAVSGQPAVPFAAVLNHFNAFYGAYVRAIKWIARFERHENLRVASTYGTHYDKWKPADTEFRAALAALNEWPEYTGKLKIVIESKEVMDFLEPTVKH
jgi:hypothetical protein